MIFEEKRTQIARRRKALEDARKILAKEQKVLQELREATSDQMYGLNCLASISVLMQLIRQKYSTLLASILPVRTTILQVVATIYPIEPIEPRDLLFGILNLPLPIPVGANDPAPPHSIPNDGTYNDETMASALGFVAQVVNLVAAYLNDAPVYPIICQGSRSLIKDPISAMMGPRMYVSICFILQIIDFMTGFLYMPEEWIHIDLNMAYSYSIRILNWYVYLHLVERDLTPRQLMAERNLQALDLRHTLPNLMNLLLTLTSGATITLKYVQFVA